MPRQTSENSPNTRRAMRPVRGIATVVLGVGMALASPGNATAMTQNSPTTTASAVPEQPKASPDSAEMRIPTEPTQLELAKKRLDSQARASAALLLSMVEDPRTHSHFVSGVSSGINNFDNPGMTPASPKLSARFTGNEVIFQGRNQPESRGESKLDITFAVANRAQAQLYETLRRTGVLTASDFMSVLADKRLGDVSLTSFKADSVTTPDEAYNLAPTQFGLTARDPRNIVILPVPTNDTVEQLLASACAESNEVLGALHASI